MRTPKRFANARVEDLDKKAFAKVLEYWENRVAYFRKGVGLVLSGPNGVGKTHALAAITNGLQRIDSEFVPAVKAIEAYSQFDDVWDEYREQPYAHTLETVSWLVLDDIGKEYRGGKLQEQATFRLGSLLRTRSDACLVTHISTNLFPAKRIREEYGDSVASLMNETMIAVEVAGKDRRGHAR